VACEYTAAGRGMSGEVVNVCLVDLQSARLCQHVLQVILEWHGRAYQPLDFQFAQDLTLMHNMKHAVVSVQ
jgi:hypothetical protein